MTQEQLIRNLQAPAGHVDVILDTDAYNEIDDQFAIAYLINSQDKATTVGLTALYIGGFGASHPLAKKIGPWPAVFAVTGASAGAAYLLSDSK